MLRWALPGGASTAAYPRHGKAHGGQIGGRRWSRFTHESSIVTRQKIWPRDQRARKSSKDGCHVYEQKSHQRTYSNFLGPIPRIFGIVQICALMCYDVLCHNASCDKLARWCWTQGSGLSFIDDVCSTLILVRVPAVACSLGRMFFFVLWTSLNCLGETWWNHVTSSTSSCLSDLPGARPVDGVASDLQLALGIAEALDRQTNRLRQLGNSKMLQARF